MYYQIIIESGDEGTEVTVTRQTREGDEQIEAIELIRVIGEDDFEMWLKLTFDQMISNAIVKDFIKQEEG